jgi:hypothetical protein
MGTVVIDTKKLDLNACINGVSPKHREQVYFIRIGIINDYSPKKIEMQKDSDGRLIVTPPRLNGLRIKQQSFHRAATVALCAAAGALRAAATSADAASAAAPPPSCRQRHAVALLPPPGRRQAAAKVALLRCCHRR